ncbi:hypothetical protein [Prevotella jejuni]
MKFNNENGFTREFADSLVKSRDSIHKGFVEMEDGRVFFTHFAYNDRVAPHLQIMTCKKTGVRFNVNLNNGIAYRTNL